MTTIEDQVIALAGLFQATEAVHEIAKSGHCEPTVLDTAVASLIEMNPATALDVFGSIDQLSSGFKSLISLLDSTPSKRQVEPVRYAMALMHLERQLTKNPDMLSAISNRLKQAENQISHFGPSHENVYHGFASIYTDTISTFKLRIQVAGKQEHLQIPLNAAKIRTLLFSGIRSAMLWRQVGGHRWHLLFKKKRLLDTCYALSS